MSKLPPLEYERLRPTRDYLQDVAKVLGKLQQVFLAADPHDWQRGLVVNMRGPGTQTFLLGNEEARATMDLVTHKVRLDGSKWLLADYDAPELMKNVRAWLESRKLMVHIEEPVYSTGATHYDPEQATAYAQALWWMDERFRAARSELEGKGGLASPVLLYPHHFDLSLSWFSQNDERQLTLGWSTGDETITEPYLYLTGTPKLTLSSPAYWNDKDFSGAILLYKDLAAADNPDELFRDFATHLIN